MGRLAKSLRKARHLGGFGGGFKEFVDALNKKSDQNEFNKLMQNAISEIQKTFANKPEEDISFTPGTRLGKDLKPPVVDIPGQTGLEINEVPEDILLGDATGRKFGTITEDEQRMSIQKTIAETLVRGGQLRNLDPSKLKQGSEILGLIGKSVTPKKKGKTLKTFDPKKDIFEIDDEGNFKIIRKGIAELKKERTVGSYTSKEGFNITKIFDPNDGSIREVKSKNKVRPPKGTTIKFPKPEKWKDFGAIINFIDYKEDDDGNLIGTSPVEKKQNREIAQNQALGTMLPGSISFAQTRIFDVWNKENMSQADFEAEVMEGLDQGELSAEEAQDLIDYNQFRPFIYDELLETTKVPEDER